VEEKTTRKKKTETSFREGTHTGLVTIARPPPKRLGRDQELIKTRNNHPRKREPRLTWK